MKKFSKFFVAVIAATLLSLFICGTVYAEKYVEWSLSKDGKTLESDENTYTYYSNLYNEIETGKATNTFRYSNDIRYNGDSYRISSYEKGGDIVCLDHYSETTRIYVTKKGEKILDDFMSGISSEYMFWESYDICSP